MEKVPGAHPSGQGEEAPALIDYDADSEFGGVVEGTTSKGSRFVPAGRQPKPDKDAARVAVSSLILWCQQPRWAARGRDSELMLLHALMRRANRTDMPMFHWSTRSLAVDACLTHDQVMPAARRLADQGVLAHEWTQEGLEWELLTPSSGSGADVCWETSVTMRDSSSYNRDEEPEEDPYNPYNQCEYFSNNTETDGSQHSSHSAGRPSLAPSCNGAFRPEGFGHVGLLVSQAGFDGRLRHDQTFVYVTVRETVDLFGLDRTVAQRALSGLVKRGLARVQAGKGRAKVYLLRLGPAYSSPGELHAANPLGAAEQANDALRDEYQAEENDFHRQREEGFATWALIKGMEESLDEFSKNRADSAAPSLSFPVGRRMAESPHFLRGGPREARTWIKSDREQSTQPDGQGQEPR